MIESINVDKKMNVLIIDDEDELRSLLLLKFTNAGFKVALASTGEEAKTLLSENNFSAVLCDLNLPNSPKGRELFELSAQLASPPLFIVITGYTQDAPEVAAVRNAGIKHIFSKPLRLKNILQLISSSI
ncbi:MAG: hypothetical protein RJB13_1755 [Pseudomonadota bacterium]|jgi:DNA-binding NtrC family response regulator